MPPHLHLILQLLTQHAVQLLHVMLHEGIVGAPAKGLSEVFGGHAGAAVLELHAASKQHNTRGSHEVALEGGGQGFDPSVLNGDLHLVKQALQGQRQALAWLISLASGHVVHSLHMEPMHQVA